MEFHAPIVAGLIDVEARGIFEVNWQGDLDSLLLAEQAQDMTIGSGRTLPAKVCDFLFGRRLDW